METAKMTTHSLLMGPSRAPAHSVKVLTAFISSLILLFAGSLAFADDYKKSDKYPAPDKRYGSNSPRGQQIIRCNSNDYEYEFCRVNGRIDRAWIANQRSLAECSLGYTWGFSRNGIWTRNGCRAEFAVQLNPRARGNTGYESPRQQYGSGYGSYGNGSYGNGSYGYGNSGYGGYDDDRYYDGDYRGNRSRGRRDAIDLCFCEIEERLRRQGYRDVRLSRVIGAERREHGWKVKLNVDVRQRSNWDEPYWRGSRYDGRNRHYRKAKVSCRVKSGTVRIKDFDWR